MSVFIDNMQNEATQLAIDAFDYIQQNQFKEDECTNKYDEVMAALLRRKALTYIIVTMNLFVQKYLPERQDGKMIEIPDGVVGMLPQAINQIQFSDKDIYKRAYSFCMRVLRIDEQARKQIMNKL